MFSSSLTTTRRRPRRRGRRRRRRHSRRQRRWSGGRRLMTTSHGGDDDRSSIRRQALSSVRTISGGIRPTEFLIFSLSRRPGSTSLPLERPQLNFDGGGGRATSSVEPAKLNSARGQREQTRRASQNSWSMESSEIVRGRK